MVPVSNPRGPAPAAATAKGDCGKRWLPSRWLCGDSGVTLEPPSYGLALQVKSARADGPGCAVGAANASSVCADRGMPDGIPKHMEGTGTRCDAPHVRVPFACSLTRVLLQHTLSAGARA